MGWVRSPSAQSSALARLHVNRAIRTRLRAIAQTVPSGPPRARVIRADITMFKLREAKYRVRQGMLWESPVILFGAGVRPLYPADLGYYVLPRVWPLP